MSNSGKKVKVDYVGTLDDGTTFDSSITRGTPLEFVCGAGQMIPGFDTAVESMSVGETHTVRIVAADAYGEHNPKLTQVVAIEQLPQASNLSVGDAIYVEGPGGRQIPLNITAMDEKEATLDMNHPMAGKDLNFEITLLEAE